MATGLLKRTLKTVFGSRNARIVKRASKTVVEINALETELQRLSDEDLAAKTTHFRGDPKIALTMTSEDAVI